jgi:hypothetical protein
MLFLDYLKKVIELDKTIFIIIIIFIMGQGFFTYKGVETFPFFNYGMYSSIFSKPEFLEVLYLKINDNKVNIKDSKYKSNSFISSQLNYYYYQNKDNNFGEWLNLYLQKSSSLKINKIDLVVSKFSPEFPYQLLKEDVYPLYDK